MPDLRRALADHEPDLLRLIADLWGLEMSAAKLTHDALAAALLEPEGVAAQVGQLPAEVWPALQALRTAPEQRLLVATFMRRFGELRAMGAVRRQREQPWRNQPSVTETLWYHGLVGRGFWDVGRGPEEFFYLPDDLRAVLGAALLPAPSAPPGAAVAPPPQMQSAAGLAAADAVTLLAYLSLASPRLTPEGLPPKAQTALLPHLRLPAALPLNFTLARQLRWVAGTPLKLRAEPIWAFLDTTPTAQARALADAWRTSTLWDDLRQLPGLVFEGQGWRNDPPAARAALLRLLAEVPVATWWSLPAFVAALKERQPDFQRPGGDYDSWYIRDAATQAYVRGFGQWEKVEGALVAWVITQPLFWLGIVELGEGADNTQCFRLTPFGHAWLNAEAMSEAVAPLPALTLDAAATVHVPHAAPAAARFQLARVAQWLPPEKDHYAYRFTPAALARAKQKGLTLARLLSWFDKTLGDQPHAPALRTALQRWHQRGPEAAVREVTLLTLRDAKLLAMLRQNPKFEALLGETLNATTVLVPREKLAQLRAVLVGLGILVDGESSEQ